MQTCLYKKKSIVLSFFKNDKSILSSKTIPIFSKFILSFLIFFCSSNYLFGNTATADLNTSTLFSEKIETVLGKEEGDWAKIQTSHMEKWFYYYLNIGLGKNLEELTVRVEEVCQETPNYYTKSVYMDMLLLERNGYDNSTLLMNTCEQVINPTELSEGFNAFIENDITFTSGDIESAVALGGDLTLAGTFTVCGNSSGNYTVNGDANPTGLLIGGQLNYTSGNGVTVNQNAFTKLGNTSGTTIHDMNNGTPSLTRLTNGGYDATPRVSLQIHQDLSSVEQNGLLDFTAIFNEFRDYSTALNDKVANNSFSISGTTATVNLLPNEVNIIQTSSAELANITALIFSNQPSINTPLIINVDAANIFNWTPPSFNGIGDHQGAFIFINFPITTNLTITGSQTITGTVFAPNADFVKNTSGNVNGQVIAKSFVMTNGELHNHVFNATFPIDTCTNICALTNMYPGFSIDAANNSCNFIDYNLGNNLGFFDNGDGTATIKGNIIDGVDADWDGVTCITSPCGANDSWYLELNLSDKQNWTEWQANGGTSNVHANCSADNLDFWNVSGTLTGLGCNSGRTLTINSASNNYRLQIGYGGNSNDLNCDFGLSTWFDIEENGSPIQADIYAFLDVNCYQKEICDNNIDDDGDGLIDGQDPDCSSTVACNCTGTNYFENPSFENGNWTGTESFVPGVWATDAPTNWGSIGPIDGWNNGTAKWVETNKATDGNKIIYLHDNAGGEVCLAQRYTITNTTGELDTCSVYQVCFDWASFNPDFPIGRTTTSQPSVDFGFNNITGTKLGFKSIAVGDILPNQNWDNLDWSQVSFSFTLTGDLAPPPGTASMSVNISEHYGQANGILIDNTNFCQKSTTCPPQIPSTNHCYLISDGAGDGHLTPDTFYTFNHTTGAVVAIGETGTLNIEAMAYDTVNQIIYTSDHDDFGTINIATGVFTAISTDMGSLNGSAGIDHVNDLDGMTYDYANNLIWATERISSGIDGLPDDMLIKIDPATGMPLPDGFGAGVGYLVIATNEHDLDDITMAADGTLYAISNYGGSGNQRLGTINTTTGVFTEIGDYGIQDVEGLTFTATGQLLATTGEDGNHKNALYSIDAATAKATFIGSIFPAQDVEACVCTFGNFSNLQIGDKVWADLNNDGLQTVGEPGVKNVVVNLLDSSGNPVLDASNNPRTTTTNEVGIYNFDRLTAGNYIIEFELPTGTTFTTKDLGANEALDSDANTSTGRSGIITLSGSINNLDVDAGLLNTNVVERTCADDGQLFVADMSGYVLRYDQNTGVLIDTFIAGLSGPMEMIVGDDNWLYISNQTSYEIQKYSLITGALVEVLVTNVEYPNGMAFGSDGFLYANSRTKDKVIKIDPATGIMTDFVAPKTAGLDSNNGGLEFGSDGNLYVASKNTDQVLRYNGITGVFIDTFVTTASGGLNAPEDLIFGPDGHLYVSSLYSDQIKRYNGTTGAFINNFVTHQSGGLEDPTNLTFGADGNLYVSSQTGVKGILRYNGTTGAFIDVFATGLTLPNGLLFAPVPNCEVEICDDNIDNDGDGLTDCEDPDCHQTIIASLSFSNCVKVGNAFQATMTVVVEWANAPDGENLIVTANGTNQTIDILSGATSPATVQFTIPADNTQNNPISINYANGGACAFSSTYNAPAPCPTPTDRDKPCNNASGYVGGVVFKDLDANGLQDTGEPGIAGILVTATDSTSATVGQTTTNNLGVFEFTSLTDGQRLRIEFTAIPTGMYATNGSSFKGTTVQFVAAPTCATTLGLIDPDENPCIGSNTSILQNGYSVVGSLPVGDNVTLAIKDIRQLGTIWNTPANRNNNQSASVPTIHTWETADFEGEEIFSMALDSRDGTIYAIASPLYSPDPQNPGVIFNKAVSPKVFKINAKTGNVSRIAKLNGSLGLGYIDFDIVHEQLFVTNMDDGKIYRLNTDGAVLGSFDPLVADNGIKGQLPALGDRILGVTFNPIDKRVYYTVWANHTTFTTGYSRVNTNFNSVRSVALDANGDFLPATDRLEFNAPYAFSVNNYTSPIGDIAFNRAGDRLLIAETSLYEINATGEISTGAHLSVIREFSKTTGSWIIEPTYATNSEGKYDVGSQLFYKGRNSRGGIDWAYKSVAGDTIHGNDDYILAVGDAIHVNAADGDDIYGYQFTPSTGGNIANSVLIDLDDDIANPYKYVYGDVDIYKDICAYLSLEIGNYVWLDKDEDGIQDPNENGLASVNVTLFNALGDSLTTVMTNADGEYYFNEYTNGFSGLNPNTTYYVVIGKGGQFNVSNGTLNSTFTTTIANTGMGNYNDWNDSDALIGNNGNGHPAFVVGYPFIQVQTGNMGQNNHTYDFGFREICSATIAVNDSIRLCPSLDFSGSVAQNDSNLKNKTFSLLTPPTYGTAIVDANGAFTYTSTTTICATDQFVYRVCDPTNTCCTSAVVHLTFSDDTKPTLLYVPADDTISCDEALPLPPQIFAVDNCPEIGLAVKEVSTQGEDGCSLYDYTITRTWTATDQCGNSTSDSQIIDVQDVVAPDIFRIYTLPNGKKMVAGVMEFVGKNWKTVNLPIDFATKPIILHQVVTSNDATPVVSQIRNTSVSQFQLRIKEEENNDNLHTRESVAWIAMETGVQSTDYQLEMNSLFVSNALKSVSFQNAFTTTPALFTSTQTTNEMDPFAIRHSGLTNAGMNLMLQEEASKDAELAHANEKIGYLAIENIGDLREEKGILMGEVGTVNVSNTWQTITLNNEYANPVIIANSLSNINGEAAAVRVRNVGLNSFEVSVQEWAYLDGIHPNETVSYLVIEGSIPLESPTYCDTGTDNLEIGIDFKAVDNCDVSVVINYTETAVFFGAKKIIQRTWSAEDECGNANSYTQQINCEGVSLRIKSVLQGAMIKNQGDGLMRDDLRKKGLLPYEEPYAKMNRFKHINGGGEVADSSVFQIEGHNGIVDWVFLELRDPADIETVVTTMSALIQCDGDVVSVHGDSILHFKNVPVGDYYVAIRHRNHLGTVSLNPSTFSPTEIPFVDFSYAFTPVVGTNSSVKMDNLQSLWAGDLNNDGKIIYQGPNNDIFYMFLHVLLEENNLEALPNYISRGYTPNDFNLDGTVIYQGPNNDRANLLFSTILTHPKNPQKFSNFIIIIGN